MAFNVSSLPNYVEQQEYPLLFKSLFSAKTMQLFRKQPGVKGQAAINIFDQDVVFQPGGCGFNPSGSTTLSQRTIVTAFMKVDKSYCPDDLRNYYLQAQLSPGSYEEEIPFEQEFAEKQAEVIAVQIETALWQSDKNSTAPNLSYFDGFVKVISGSGAYQTGSYHVSASSGFAALSGSGVFNVVQGVWSAIPAAVIDQEDVAVFCGRDVFTLYQQYLVSANLYHYVGDADKNVQVTIPASGLKLIALNGLNGTYKIYAGRMSNFVIGVDVEDDSTSKFKMWWDESTQTVKFTCKWTVGVNVAFPAEIVYWYNGQ